MTSRAPSFDPATEALTMSDPERWVVLHISFFFKFYLYIFIFGCAGFSLLLLGLFSRCGERGLLSRCSARVSHRGGCPCCRAWAPGRERFGSRGPWLSHCGSPALQTGSVRVAHGLSCSVAYVILPDLGLNPCLLHWQADSPPPSRQCPSHFK